MHIRKVHESMKNYPLYPLRLIPVPTAKIWGGTKLSARYAKPFPDSPDSESPDSNIRLGETAELIISDKECSLIGNGECAGMRLDRYLGIKKSSKFPVMVKCIDAGSTLSVQVHPAKTELWYIAEAEPGAEIIYGLNKSFKKKRFSSELCDGRIKYLLNKKRVHPGEFYMIPPGFIHAIGRGVLAVEFQQNNDITERIYDFGRGRPLQTENAVKTINLHKVFKEGDGIAIPGLSCCSFFSVSEHSCSGSITVQNSLNPTFLTCVKSSPDAMILGNKLIQGDSYYIPAGCAAEIQGIDVTFLTMTW